MEKEEAEILDLLDLRCAQALQVIKTRTMQYSIRHSKEMGGDGFLASHSGSNFDRINPLKLGMESQITNYNYKLLFDPKPQRPGLARVKRILSRERPGEKYGPLPAGQLSGGLYGRSTFTLSGRRTGNPYFLRAFRVVRRCGTEWPPNWIGFP